MRPRIITVVLPVVLGLLSVGGGALAQDRYSAGAGAALRGPASPTTPGFAAAARPQRMLTWPGKAAGAGAAPSSLTPPTVQVAPTPVASAPETLRPAPLAARPMPARSPAALYPSTTPARAVAAAPTPPPAVTPAMQAEPKPMVPAPVQPRPMAQAAIKAPPALPTSIYAPPPPAGISSDRDWPSSAPQPQAGVVIPAPQPAGPSFAATGAQQSTLRHDGARSTFAAADGGAPTRQYSVHRQFGGKPDPIRMPADFFGAEAPADLAEPPPPLPRRVQTDGKSQGQIRAAERAAAATSE